MMEIPSWLACGDKTAYILHLLGAGRLGCHFSIANDDYAIHISYTPAS